MKKLLIIILVTPLFLKAQYTRKDSLEYTYFAIKTSPLSLLDPIISTAPIGFEYRHKQKYAIEAMYYFLIPQAFPNIKGKENEDLVKFKVDIRRYFNDEFYVSFEYGFQKYQYDFTEDYYTAQEDLKFYSYDFATINKKIHLFNIKVGVEYIAKNPRYIFDLYTGVGGRYVDLFYSDVQNKTLVTSFPVDGFELGRNSRYDSRELSKLKGNFLIGFRFGYKLWSKF
jgi:hypothetical protein